MMQTFLPYRLFTKSALCLDYKRLGKQRVEAKQILDVLEGKTDAWKNHPTVRMWRGYEDALRWYHNTMITEWINRGYKNTMKILPITSSPYIPWWLENEKFCSSHRAALLHKNYDYYKNFGWSEKPELNYYWPV